MPAHIRPHDGARLPAAAINLNKKGFKRGDRVLYESLFGWKIADIHFDDLTGNNQVRIGIESVDVRKIHGRVPQAADEAAIIASMEATSAARGAAVREAEDQYQAAVKAALKDFGVK